MSATAERMTVEQYYEITVEGDRKQLVDGAIVVNDEPRMTHGQIQGRIWEGLLGWVRAGSGRGSVWPPIDVVMSPHDVYGPDLVWIDDENPPRDESDRLVGIPDLCVEIRSPSTWRYNLGAKKDAYERGGLPELWLVDDVDERVLVYRRSKPDSPTFDVELELHVGDALASPQLPGFALSLEELFRR